MGRSVACFVAAAAILLASRIHAAPVVQFHCTISSEWIVERITHSTRVSKPTHREFVDVARDNGIYEVEASFADDGSPNGEGTFFGLNAHYTKNEANITYELSGFGSATLDSLHGTLRMDVTDSSRIDYLCAK